MKNTILYIAECVYNNEYSDEELRLSSCKVILGSRGGGTIPEWDLLKVERAYEGLLRAGQITGF